MDAYQQHHRFMRPPPPPPPATVDPHHHLHLHLQQPPPPPRPPVPPHGSWYSTQFQYHAPAHSPSPPPPPPQWGGPPPPPPSSAYPPHLPPHGNYFPPPPRPHVPPHAQIPQSYPQSNQEWGNPSWAHHQGWDYRAHENAEDWGARAREWAAAKAAMEDQHSHSQFTPVGRPEEQNQFHDQHQQAADSHYLDSQQQSYTVSSYQQFPVPGSHPHRPPIIYPQDSASASPIPSSHAPNGRPPYTVRDGTLAGDQNAGFSHPDNLPTSLSVHQQEVPSSYSSITGRENTAEQKEQSYKSLSYAVSTAQEGQYYAQSAMSALGGSVLSEHPFAYGNQAADATVDLSDQPLDFAPRSNLDHDPHMQSGYAAHHDSAGSVRGIDPIGAMTHSWTTPVAPAVVYPAVLPSGQQHDPSVVIPSSVTGHAAPPFGRFPGPNFQSTIPATGSSFGPGAGTAVHPAVAFQGDMYGVTAVPERPKKASVPNWLKEEIIKTKAVISKSSIEHPQEEANSIEDDGVDKALGKGDQADSKSIDSSKSTEEDDDDEDYVEAARTAAINQEIKRVLTEVLLKVTDELFDEIATEVLNEDDVGVEVAADDLNPVTSNHEVSMPPPVVPISKSSAKVLVPAKAKELETEDLSETSSSSAPGNVLGLANYASDDDDDNGDEIQSLGMPNSRKESVLQNSGIKNLSEEVVEATENREANLGSKVDNNGVDGGSEHARSSTVISEGTDEQANINGGNVPNGKKRVATKQDSDMEPENGGEKRSVTDDSQRREKKVKSDKNDRHESKRISLVKDCVNDVESRSRADEKGDESHKRQDERRTKREKIDDHNSLKERVKEQSERADKSKEPESRRRSTHLDVKEERRDNEKVHKANVKEDANRKGERAKVKEEERSRHKLASDSSRHKRRRSSSNGSRGRDSKDNNAHDSSDEASDDSRRKCHSRKRSLSPSPVRSRRRQVSRSPHSKHSQRRHSPYSSLETTRRRRSRSKSPARRHR